jgi:uncharacterized membrane protein
MNDKNFKIFRIAIIIIVAMVVGAAVTINNFYLALFGILIGILFNILVRKKFRKKLVDERVENISGKAAKMAYTITTMLLALLALFLILSARTHQDVQTEALGVTFSYIAMLNLAIYSISYSFFNKKYGGDE